MGLGLYSPILTGSRSACGSTVIKCHSLKVAMNDEEKYIKGSIQINS